MMNIQRTVVGLFVCSILVVGGCSSSDPSTNEAGGDAGSAADTGASTTPDAATPTTDSGTDAATGVPCPSTLTNMAPEIDEMNVAATTPAPTGGTTADGIYFLTARSEYVGSGGVNGPRGHKRKETLRIKGAVLEIAKSRDGSPDVADTVTLTISGTTLTLVQACSASPATVTAGFDASPTSITIYEAAPNEGKASTFTRQP
jgi:hypothetical protein